MEENRPGPTEVSKSEKELLIGQRGLVIWLFGLSGAGKSTIATALERHLYGEGIHTAMLDGDGLRAALNRGLGFSDADRAENLRRAAEVAKLMAACGLVVICAFITPLKINRKAIRELIGQKDLVLVHISASFAVCQQRDPKGLYAKAAQGMIRQFTGRDSGFETPEVTEADLVLDTERAPLDSTLNQLVEIVLPRIQRT